jgi:hypothetical protein
MDNLKPLRFGVLGAAKIARSFIAGVAKSELIDVAAVASRDLEKGNASASVLGVGRVHGSYEALLDDPSIEAVYVPLPNTLHAEWVIKDRSPAHVCQRNVACVGIDQAFAGLTVHGLITETENQFPRISIAVSSCRFGQLASEFRSKADIRRAKVGNADV